MPSPTMSTTSLDSSKPLVRSTQEDRTTPSWQEPHPGRRLPLPGESAQHYYGCSVQAEEFWGGMAAKDSVPSRTRKRRARLRLRQLTPKPLLIPAKVPEELEGKTAVRSAVETPLDGLERREGSDKDEDTPRACLPPLADLSNHLGIEVDGSDDMFDFIDAGSFCEISAGQDWYGWEAELERRQRDELAKSPASHSDRLRFQHHRSDEQKRSLIHRVFSRGHETWSNTAFFSEPNAK